MTSQKKQRALASSLTDPNNLVAEKAPLTFKVDDGIEMREKPVAYIPNLVKKVADVVTQHERYTHLCLLHVIIIINIAHQKDSLFMMEGFLKISCG